MQFDKKSSVIIDGEYLRKSLVRLKNVPKKDVKINYGELINQIEKRSNIEIFNRFFVLATRRPDRQNFVTFSKTLEAHQFEIITGTSKYVKLMGSEERTLRQSNVDGLIMMQMVFIANDPTVTDIILIAGDGDFKQACEYVIKLNKQLWILFESSSLSKKLLNLPGIKTICMNEFYESICL